MTKSSVIFLCTLSIFSALPAILQAITSIHHDKPEDAQLTKMAVKMRSNVTSQRVPFNVTILNSERQKRLLLPYMNYYNYQKAPSENGASNPEPKEFTPFLKSNALSGPFLPMNIRNVDFEEAPPPPSPPPNYSTIYDKLSRLKLVQHIQPTRFRKPQVYVAAPFKASVDTYTPTTIEIPQPPPREEYKPRKPVVYKIFRAKPAPQYITLEVAQQYQQQQEYYKEKEPPKPFVYYPQKPAVYEETTIQKPYTTPRPIVNTIIDDEYVAQKFTQLPPQYVPKTYQPKYQPVYFPTTPTPVPQDNSNVLQQILNELQRTNTLPSSLTSSNIDNSIRTLVKILDALKNKQKFTRPIVVAEENSAEVVPEVQHHPPVAQIPEVPHHHPVATVPDVQHHNHHHHHHHPVPVEVIQEVPAVEFVPQPIEDHEKSYTQSFPANTVEGGTPGRPGIDYPALSTIPQTSFNCKMQRYKGFFGDPDTNCQVWHYCDLNGGQASFLCPNGTIFSQVALTCDWWYNVKCSSTAQLYVLNERLYKYILPLSPKFPEDYSGPLVDKYLALKFKEMEEKMRKQKNRKQDSGENNDEEEVAEDNESDNATTEKSQSET